MLHRNGCLHLAICTKTGKNEGNIQIYAGYMRKCAMHKCIITMNKRRKNGKIFRAGKPSVFLVRTKLSIMNKLLTRI